MKNDILSSVLIKNDYLTIMEAVTGAKTSFTQEEKTHLLNIYLENAATAFGVRDATLLKLLAVLDTAPDKAAPETSPLAGDLDAADIAALTNLITLCKDWNPTPEKAQAVKATALGGGTSAILAQALARAALDVYAGRSDITPYQEDINTLAAFLKQADEETFSDASTFLIRVRGRCR